MEVTAAFVVLNLIFFGKGFAQTTDPAICRSVKLDNRTMPGEMNDSPGTFMNLFPDVRTPISGRVAGISYFAVNTGTVFLSFWKETTTLGRFELVIKIPIVVSDTYTVVNVNLADQFIWLESGSILALHYENDGSNGCIDFEHTNKVPLTGVQTYPVWTEGIRDSNWVPGQLVQFEAPSFANFEKAAALHVEICECDAGTYGTNCTGNCSAYCAVAGQCDRVTGDCFDGCLPGYRPPLCNQACDDGYYGQDCAMECRCNEPCHKEIGYCESTCHSGWEGIKCDIRIEEVKDSTEDDGGKTGLLAGIVILFLIAVIASAAIVVLAWKRFRRNPKERYREKDEVIIRKADPEDVEIDIISSNIQNGNVAADETEDESENPYYNMPAEKPKTKSRPIEVSQYHTVLMGLTTATLHNEYLSMHTPKTQTKPWTEASNSALVPKNKFKNILPYDGNRVKLEKLKDDPLTDYINASFVPGYQKADMNNYIASQGPQERTVDDFWRMIWQYNVYGIVMLTNLTESMKIKCVQYWPESDKGVTFGGVSIKLQKEEIKTDIVIRHLKITKDSETRWLKQFHYVGWPDHGVPETTETNFTLLADLKAFHKSHRDSPIVVHCSAGVGRTGTFISLDYLLDQAAHENKLDVLQCVNRLRSYRVSMVQSSSQYRFIYAALDERLALGGTEVQLSSGKATLESLLQTEEGKSKLKEQYQFLDDTRPNITAQEMQGALDSANKTKNRDMNILPADAHRMQLETEDGRGGDYINAIDVDGFKDKAGYCVTQVPLDNTQNDFWRLIMENNIQNIVYLQSKKPTHEKWLPQQGIPLEFGMMSAMCKKASAENGFTVMEVEVGRAGQQGGGDLYANVNDDAIEYANTAQTDMDTMLVKVFKHPHIDTLERSTESMTESLSRLREAVSRVSIAGQPVAVVCLNGSDDCGVYIACDIISRMITLEGQTTFDVFNAVQRIRRKRPQFIPHYEQYGFLHRFALKAVTEAEKPSKEQ